MKRFIDFYYDRPTVLAANRNDNIQGTRIAYNVIERIVAEYRYEASAAQAAGSAVLSLHLLWFRYPLSSQSLRKLSYYLMFAFNIFRWVRCIRYRLDI